MIEPGTQAPAFTLPDQDGNEVSLSDFVGQRLVIAFYPQDFSSVCSDQMSIYQEVLGEIRGCGADLIGISVDSSHAHRAFREHLNLKMPLLSDFHPKGETIKAYGAYLEDRGHANRSLVLVDENGVVEWVHEADTPLEIPGANLIFDALASNAPAE